MKHNYNVEIKKISLGWKKQGVFAIREGNDFYTKSNDEVRTFKNQSGAINYLKNCCKKYPEMNFIITMMDGTVKKIGEEELSENDFGCHEWSKKNPVTIMDKSGSYDIYICKFCRKEEKSYGLSGHSLKSGVCPKNPIK